MEEKKSKMSLGDLANLLHSSIFSLEKAVQEKMGREHIIITSHAAKYIASIEKTRGSKLFTGVDLDKAIKNFVNLTSGSDFYDRVDVKKINDEEYSVKIEGCALAKTGVHAALNPERDVCPMALAVAAIFKHIEPDRDVIAEPSKFSEQGTLTQIHFIKIV